MLCPLSLSIVNTAALTLLMQGGIPGKGFHPK
jgi:hypothetical protein